MENNTDKIQKSDLQSLYEQSKKSMEQSAGDYDEVGANYEGEDVTYKIIPKMAPCEEL